MAKVNNSSKAHSYDSVPAVEADSGSQKSTTSAYKRHAVYSPNEWLSELISSAVALGLVVALGTIFWSMDNKALYKWNSRISLSTSISILTTAYAIATVKWNLATIGAAITILRLSFAPFAQQVILLEQRDVVSPVGNIATFGYAHDYSRHAVFDFQKGISTLDVPQDAGMQSAIFQDLYGVNTTEPFTCPGVCRWPGSYISLGFKAECRNVTQQTLQTANCRSFTSASYQCNMTTPGGVMLDNRQEIHATTYFMNTISLMLGPILPDTFPEFMRFAIFRSTPDDSYRMQDINITECSLSLTAYEYVDAKANGSDFSFSSRREVDFGVKHPWLGEEVGDGNMRWTRIFTNESTRGDVHIPALNTDLPNLLTLTTFLTSNSIVSEFGYGYPESTGLGVSAALIGDVDLNARFDGMATAMTNYIRYGPNTQTAYGEVIQSEPFVSIRWGYFAVPIAIEALAIVFAILSIFNNRRSRNVPLWKSSTLAVLACQHNEQLELLQTTCKGIDEIQFEAETLKVQLQ